MSDDADERDRELAETFAWSNEEAHRFRASLFRIALACAFAAGYLGGVLSTALGLPWIMLVFVLLALAVWVIRPQ